MERTANQPRSPKKGPQGEKRARAETSEELDDKTRAARALKALIVSNNLCALSQKMVDHSPHLIPELKKMPGMVPSVLDHILKGPKSEIIPLGDMSIHWVDGRLEFKWNPNHSDSLDILDTLTPRQKGMLGRVGSVIQGIGSDTTPSKDAPLPRKKKPRRRQLRANKRRRQQAHSVAGETSTAIEEEG